MTTLEDVLQALGSDKPFLDSPIEVDVDGYTEYLTESGSKAYSKLIDIVYALGGLIGEDFNSVVETLDDIVDDRY